MTVLKQCPKCLKEFNNNTKYDIHVNRQNSCDSRICLKCHAVFTRKWTRDYHVNNNVCQKQIELLNPNLSSPPMKSH